METENDSASISTSWLSVTTPQPRNTEARRDNTSTTFTSESTVARLLNAINALNESLSPKSKVNETYEQTVIDQQQSGTTQEPLNYFNATHSFNKQHDYDNSERLQLASTEISYNSSFHAADNSVHDFGSSTQQQQQQPSTHNSPQESEYDKSSYSWTNNGYFTSTEFSQQSTYKDVVNDHAEHLHSSSVSDGQTELIEASFLNAYETPHYQDPLSTIDGRDDSDHPTDGPTEIFAHEPSDSPTYDNYDNGNSSPNQDQVDINSPTTETNVNKGDIINDGTNVFFDSRASATTITTHTQQAENHDLTTINETDSNVSGTEYTPWISNDEYQYAENTTSSWDEQRNHVDLSINDGLEPKTAFNRTETSNDFSNSSLASINDEDASTSSISDQQVTDNNENDEKAISTRSDHSTPEPVTVQEHQTDYYKDLTAGVNTAVAEIVSSLLQDPVVTTTKTIESSSSNSSWNENVSGEAPTTKGEVSELSSLVSEVNDTENAIVEHTTLSGVDVFVNTPLENLINASVITAMDLSTVTSIINPQSSSYRPTDVDQVSYEANFNSKYIL